MENPPHKVKLCEFVQANLGSGLCFSQKKLDKFGQILCVAISNLITWTTFNKNSPPNKLELRWIQAPIQVCLKQNVQLQTKQVSDLTGTQTSYMNFRYNNPETDIGVHGTSIEV